MPTTSTRLRSAGATALVLIALWVIGAPAAAAGTPPANTPVTTSKPYSFQEPWLAVDPRNHQRMAIAYREGAQRSVCSLALSSDGGTTWQTQDLIGPQGRLAWPGQDTLCYEAVAAFGPDGTLYYAVQATISFRDPYSRVLVASSSDAVAFHAPVDVDPDHARNAGDVGGGDWYPRLAVAPGSGKLFVRWTHYASRNASAQSVIASSTDRGTTFSAPVVATPAAAANASLVDSFGTALAAGQGGAVYTSWLDLTRRQAGCTAGRAPVTATCSMKVPLEAAASHDGGRTFGAAVVVDPAVDFGCPGRNVPGTTALASCDNLHFDRGPEAYSLTAGVTAGSAYLAWWGGDPENPARISFAGTYDGGRSWSAPRTVGALRGATADEQQRPVLAVAPNGRIDIAYYDDTNGGDQDVYLVSSDDGGTIFSAPQLVTSTSSNINIGPVSEDGVHAGFGEWLGLFSSNSAIDVAWTDTRRGTVDSAKQDIYFAAVPLAAGTPLWLPLLAGLGGVALVLAGAAAVVYGRARRAETEGRAQSAAGPVRRAVARGGANRVASPAGRPFSEGGESVQSVDPRIRSRLLAVGAAAGAALLAGCGGSSSAPASSPGGSCQGSSGNASTTTASYIAVLDVGPPETMYMPDQVAAQHPTSGEVMLGGSMTDVSGPDVRHVEVHICNRSSGSVVTGLQPTIALLDTTANTASSNLPVAAMQGVEAGPSDYHYGNNATLQPGHRYTITVRLHGETATLRYTAA